MPIPAVKPADASDPRIDREARRILRRLCEKGAFLAVAPSMEKAVVLREVVPGKTEPHRRGGSRRGARLRAAGVDHLLQGRQDRLLRHHVRWGGRR